MFIRKMGSFKLDDIICLRGFDLHQNPPGLKVLAALFLWKRITQTGGILRKRLHSYKLNIGVDMALLSCSGLPALKF